MTPIQIEIIAVLDGEENHLTIPAIEHRMPNAGTYNYRDLNQEAQALTEQGLLMKKRVSTNPGANSRSPAYRLSEHMQTALNNQKARSDGH